MNPTGVAAFLMRCTDLGLSCHIGTTYDSAHLIRIDGEVIPQYICRVRSIKGSTVKRVCIREVGANPWIACGKAAEKLDKALEKK